MYGTWTRINYKDIVTQIHYYFHLSLYQYLYTRPLISNHWNVILTSALSPPNGVSVARVGRFPHVFAETPTSQPPKCRPEVYRVQGVDERIHGTIKPAEPRQECTNAVPDCARQEGLHQVRDKEWQPAGYESADYDGQCLCRFVLPLQGQDAVGHRLLMHPDIVRLDCGRRTGGACGIGHGTRAVSAARDTVVPMLGATGVVVDVIIGGLVSVRRHCPALASVRMVMDRNMRARSVHQFVLSIFVVLILVLVIVAADAVIVVVCGQNCTAVTAPAAGKRDFLLLAGISDSRSASRTGWFRFGDIFHVNFQFGHVRFL